MTVPDLKTLLARLAAAYPQLSPQLGQAAKAVLDAPEEVAMRSMRSFAAAFGIAPTTMIRLAKQAGFDSYEVFRRPFQEALRSGGGFADRAEWLQDLAAKGDTGGIVGGMAAASLGNLETAFRTLDARVIAAAADALLGARRVHVVGVGGLNGFANYFAYVARMMLGDVRLAAPAMGTMVDEFATLSSKDAMVIMGVDPYAKETVRAADLAVARKACLIAVTDSLTSPLVERASHLLMVPVASPQFFPSQTALVAMLETLIAAIVSRGDRALVSRIKAVDRFRSEQGVYWRDRS
ncbi:DNA-binding MurR/RpiR family transcriptional regulator [Rhodoligotrophos appendicifer]|uniref:MurR/RpiR family transcriptional regulator n=1 Tax=Rhodoligotrophos appendicifer TaxID=987056 RepID=UPI001185FD37|nr:MurR/RpiR family transcriptional regulator [Rhodoligotrophos appendicifer]